MIIPSPDDLREAASVLRAEMARLDVGDQTLAHAKQRMLVLNRVALWALWCAGDSEREGKKP